VSFCPFYFGHCVVCPSLIYWFWLPLWYLQTPLTWKKFNTNWHYILILLNIENKEVIIHTSNIENIRLVKTGHYLLKCLYQARKVCCHVYVLYIYIDIYFTSSDEFDWMFGAVPTVWNGFVFHFYHQIFNFVLSLYTLLVHVLIRKTKKEMTTSLLILYISFFRTLPYRHIDALWLDYHCRNKIFHIKRACINFRDIVFALISTIFDYFCLFCGIFCFSLYW
jgi:ABC-type amino acid transport system permease subunit